jgi:membrane-associated phospholipid phosphatase
MSWPRLTRREHAIVWVALVVLALVTVDVVVGGPASHFDGQVRDAIQPRPDTAPWWLSAIAGLGDLRFAIPIVGALALAASQYAWRPWPAAFATAAFAAVELAVLALKAAVGRPGPGVWADRDGYPGYFPSGHAATATAVVAIVLFTAHQLGIARLPRTAVLESCVAAGAATGALAGFRAVIGDTHWASDVVGGILLSTAVLLPAMAVCRDVLDRKALRAPSSRPRRRTGASDDFPAP